MTGSISIVGEYALTIKASEDFDLDLMDRVADDFPYKNRDGSPLTRSQLVEHLAHNAVANGVTDISELDGFADIPRGQVTFDVHEIEVDRWFSDGSLLLRGPLSAGIDPERERP